MSAWSSSGWNNTACDGGWQVGRGRKSGLPRVIGGWTPVDFVAAAVALYVGLPAAVAFLALKLWQQAAGHPGNALVFAFERWEALVAATRQIFGGVAAPFSLRVGPRSSGNHAFDAWREAELARIEAERSKLRAAEREFSAYREDLLHAKDREDFERFMRSRAPQA